MMNTGKKLGLVTISSTETEIMSWGERFRSIVGLGTPDWLKEIIFAETVCSKKMKINNAS